MTGEGGTVDDRTVAEAAEDVRWILAAVDAGELTCTAAYRHRLEGAVLALEAISAEQRPSP